MKGGPSIALVFGAGPKRKHGYESDSDESEESEDMSSMDAGPTDDFEDYADKAFPGIADDPARLKALWKAIKACVESY